MDNKDAYIVTGATGGIGQSLVSDLVDRNVGHVILACRNMEKAQDVIFTHNNADTDLIAMPLDLESFSSVREFAKLVINKDFRIKGIIHNAGTMPGELRVTKDGYESATQTNFLSPVLLTELLLPALVVGGSIVFTTSITRKIARFRENWDELSKCHHNRFVTYGRSKKMLTAYAYMLAARLLRKGISVNCSDPWVVNTNIITLGNKMIDSLCDMFVRPIIYTPSQGAASAIKALDSERTGMIFTLKKVIQIPHSYGSKKSFDIINNVISTISE